MQNPLSQLFSSLLQPTVNEQVEKALTEKQPYAFGVGMVKETSLKDAIGQPHDASFSLLYSLYKLNTDVSGCVHKWAGGITSPGWRISLMDDEAEATPAQIEEMKGIATWIKNPGVKLFESMLYEGVEHLGITGDWYFYKLLGKDGIPLELWPMHPALTRVVCTKAGEVLGYVMQVPGGEKIVFEASEVSHVRLPNPTNDISGESPLELVLEEAGIDLQALRSNKAIFANGMNPSAVILMDDKSTPSEATAITEALKQAHTGASNQHKLVALSKVKDFKPWTMTYRDLEYLKLRDLATSKITTAYRIPKVLLGHHNSGDYATTKFLIRDTYNNTYRPIQRLISEVITETVIHLFSPDYKFELLPPDASDPDVIRRDSIEAKKQGILTADEVRQDSFSKDALPEEEQPEQSSEETKSLTKSVTKADNDIDPLAQERDELMESLGMALVDPITTYFTDQETAYQSALTVELDDESLDTFVDTQKDAFDSALALLLASLLYPSLSAGVSAARTQVRSIAPADIQAAIDAALDTERANQIIQGYSKTQSFKQVTGINDTTRASLRAELAEGLRKQESVEQLSERIAKVFGKARDYRTDLIARDQTAKAFAYANYEALAKLHAEGIVKFRKWLTAPEDGRICDTCMPLNGVTVPFEEQYPGGHEPGQVHPGDRCSEVGLIEEENG